MSPRVYFINRSKFTCKSQTCIVKKKKKPFSFGNARPRKLMIESAIGLSICDITV